MLQCPIKVILRLLQVAAPQTKGSFLVRRGFLFVCGAVTALTNRNRWGSVNRFHLLTWHLLPNHYCHPSSYRAVFEDESGFFCHPSSNRAVFEDELQIFRHPSSFRPVFEDEPLFFRHPSSNRAVFENEVLSRNKVYQLVTFDNTSQMHGTYFFNTPDDLLRGVGHLVRTPGR